MKVIVTSAQIDMNIDTAIDILKADNPVDSLKTELAARHNILPDGIGTFDVENVRKGLVVGLGEREFAKLQLQALKPCSVGVGSGGQS